MPLNCNQKKVEIELQTKGKENCEIVESEEKRKKLGLLASKDLAASVFD